MKLFFKINLIYFLEKYLQMFTMIFNNKQQNNFIF